MAAELEIKALVDINSGIKALQEFGRASVKSLGTIENAFKDLNKQVQTMFKLNDSINDIKNNTAKAATSLVKITDALKSVEKNTSGINAIQQGMDSVSKSAKESAKTLGSVNTQLKGIEESTKGIKNVNDGIKDVNDGVKKVDDSVGRLRAPVMFTAIAAGVQLAKEAVHLAVEAFHLLEGQVEKAIESASEYEQSLTDMNVALALSGNYSKKASKDLEDYASSIQNTTKYSDDAVLSGFALLEQLTALDAQGLKKAGGAAIELAAALRIDLNSAFQLVGKAANGEVGAFGRYGIAIQKGKTDTETFNNALRVFSAFQGTAAGQANTFEGSLAKLNNQISDLYKQFGFTITQNPAIIEGIKGLTTVFEKMAGFVENNKSAIMRLIKDGFISIIKVIPEVFKLIDFLADGFTGLALSANVANVALNKLGKYKELAKIDFTFGLSSGAKTREKNKITEIYDEEAAAIDANRKKMLDNAVDRKRILNSLSELAKKGIDDTVATLNADNSLTEGQLRNGKKREKDRTEEIEKQRKEYEKLIKEKKDFVERLTKSPAIIFFEELPKLMSKTEAGAASAVGVLQNALEGSKGAVKLVSGFLGAMAEKILPGIGGAVGEIIAKLAEGPESAKKFVQEFLKALPEIIRNIGPALSAAIVTIIEGIPDLLAQLLQDMPKMFIEQMLAGPEKFISAIIRLIPRLIVAIVKSIPIIAREFINELARNIPSFITAAGQALADTFKDAVRGLIPNIKIPGLGGGGIGGAIGGGLIGSLLGPAGSFAGAVGGFFGFAKGGFVPGGYPNDSFPARLTSGEFVVPNNLTAGLEAMIKRDQQGGSDSDLVALLREVVMNTRNQSVSVHVGNKEIVNVLRDSLLSGRVLT